MVSDFTTQTVESAMARLRLRFASAVAAAEAAEMAPEQPADVLAFIPRAAATGDLQALPPHTEAENDEDISVHLSDEGSHIHVRIETGGFHRADSMAGRQALVVSSDDFVRYEFQFEDDGTAAFDLDATPQVTRSLAQGWRVFLAPKA